MANISVRQYIRWHPAPASAASEPTSTVVLTSPGRRFIDVRLLEASRRLEWAFAGTSSSQPAQEPGVRRAAWSHWVDSRTVAAETVRDEAEVRETGDATGTELETGRMVNPATGVEADYEEAWRSVDPVPTASGAAPVFGVLRTCDDERGVRGMIVRVGQFCQGILREGQAVTMERWEWDEELGWALEARLGFGRMPNTLLYDVETLTVGGVVEDGVRTWTIAEAGKCSTTL